MTVESFINENFITPLCHYYTLPATITYGVILVLAIIGTYKLLKHLKIRINKKFFIGLLPFIIYGGWTRALRDYNLGIYKSNIFCSPPIYFLIFSIALGSLLLGLLIEKAMKKTKYSSKFSYEKIMAIVGIVLLAYNLTLTTIKNIFGFVFILLLVIFWFLVFFIINRLKPKILSFENMGILTSHLLDASATFTAITFFNFYEQHVLPTFLIKISGPWIMFPLKIVVVWTVLFIIDSSEEDIFFKKFLKIVILILGLALGIRDLLSVSLWSI